jgi:hypothetical protein
VREKRKRNEGETGIGMGGRQFQWKRRRRRVRGRKLEYGGVGFAPHSGEASSQIAGCRHLGVAGNERDANLMT